MVAGDGEPELRWRGVLPAGLPRGAVRLDDVLGLAHTGPQVAAAGEQPHLVERVHGRVHRPEELHLVQIGAAEPRKAARGAGGDGGDGVRRDQVAIADRPIEDTSCARGDALLEVEQGGGRHVAQLASLRGREAGRLEEATHHAVGRLRRLPRRRAEPRLCWMTLCTRPCARGMIVSSAALRAPADWPNTVTFCGSPPKPPISSRTHSSAAI